MLRWAFWVKRLRQMWQEINTLRHDRLKTDLCAYAYKWMLRWAFWVKRLWQEIRTLRHNHQTDLCVRACGS